MEKTTIDVDASTLAGHDLSPKSSKIVDGDVQKQPETSTKPADGNDPAPDYSSKAKNKTTFTHYWVFTPSLSSFSIY